MPRGGARPGAGRKTGFKLPQTIAKEEAREIARRIITKHLDRLIAAQVSNAMGIKYLVVREKASGKFKRVAENAAAALDPDEEVIEVWEKDPSVQAFTDLMNRALDKPKEQEIEMKLSGQVDLVQGLHRGRARVAAAKGKSTP